VRKAKRAPARFVQIAIAVVPGVSDRTNSDGERVAVHDHVVYALDVLGRVWFYDAEGATWRWMPSTRETLPIPMGRT